MFAFSPYSSNTSSPMIPSYYRCQPSPSANLYRAHPRSSYYDGPSYVNDDAELDYLYHRLALEERARVNEEKRLAYIRAVEAERRRQIRAREEEKLRRAAEIQLHRERAAEAEEEFRRAWFHHRAEEIRRAEKIEQQRRARREAEIEAAKLLLAAAAANRLKQPSSSPSPKSPVSSPLPVKNNSSVPVRVITSAKSSAPSRLTVPLTVDTKTSANFSASQKSPNSSVLIEDEEISPDQLNLDPEDFFKADRIKTPTPSPAQSAPASPKLEAEKEENEKNDEKLTEQKSSPANLPESQEVKISSSSSAAAAAAPVSESNSFDIPVRVVNTKSSSAPTRSTLPLTVDTKSAAKSTSHKNNNNNNNNDSNSSPISSSSVSIEDEEISPEQINLDPEDFVKVDRIKTPTPSKFDSHEEFHKIDELNLNQNLSDKKLEQ